MNPLERHVLDEIERGRDELIELTSALIAFDTTARKVGDPAREEAALQDFLAARLRRAGADTEVWEPSASELSGLPPIPEGLDFAGRPQLAARFRGDSGGRSLLLNGHIDVVSCEPRQRWTSDPNRAEVRHGKLFGRGACDMKGGVAAMTFAAETLARLDVRLAGDLLVCTNTDEESSGAGGMALVAHGLRADAGIVPEPTGFDAWIACRGSSLVTIDVLGQPGHAEKPQPHWRDGGAVNAIERMTRVLGAVDQLRDDWHGRPDTAHAYLSPGDIVPTMISGGEWVVTYPALCRLTCVVAYPPTQADADGGSTVVARELADKVADAVSDDDWLREHPPEIRWHSGVAPMEMQPDAPIVETVLEVGAELGRPGRPTGLDSWFDGATFTRFGATPTIAFGPPGLDGDRTVAHTIDEFVPVDDLVLCAQALALAAVRFCGVAR